MAEQPPTSPRNSKKFSAPTQKQEPQPIKSYAAPGERVTTQSTPQQPAHQAPQQPSYQTAQQPRQTSQYGAQQAPRGNQYGAQQAPRGNQWQSGQGASRGNQYAAAGQGGGNGKKKKTLLIIIIAAAATLLVLAAVLAIVLSQADGCKQEEPEATPTATATATATPSPEPVNSTPPGKQDEPTPTPTPVSVVYKNGKAVSSPDELFLYDIVTFGKYPQGAMGAESPIEWYVIDKGDNKIKLLSLYALDSRPFHGENKEIAFKNSDLYKWLNGEFKNRAFKADEQAALASPVMLLTKDEAENTLRKSYRPSSFTPYALEQSGNQSKCNWWLGEDGKPYTYYDYWWWWEETGEGICALAMDETGDIQALQVNFHGKGIRPVVVVQF